MLEVQVRIDGGESLLREMRALGIRVSSAMRSAMRAGARVIRQRAEELAPSRRVRRRRATRTVASVRRDVVTIRVAPTKRRWYLRLVETGTAPHVIRARRGRVLVFQGRRGAVAVQVVQHPGARAAPWLRPAFEQQREAAVRAIADGLRAYIERKRAEVRDA